MGLSGLSHRAWPTSKCGAATASSLVGARQPPACCSFGSLLIPSSKLFFFSRLMVFLGLLCYNPATNRSVFLKKSFYGPRQGSATNCMRHRWWFIVNGLDIKKIEHVTTIKHNNKATCAFMNTPLVPMSIIRIYGVTIDVSLSAHRLQSKEQHY